MSNGGEEDCVRRLISIGLLVLLGVVTGCGSLMTVTRKPHDTAQGQQDGVPFYVKAGICKQQTVWMQPIYTVTLKKTPPATNKKEAVSSRTLILSLVEIRSPQFRDVVNAKVNEVEGKWDALAGIQPPDPYKLDQDNLDDDDSEDYKRVLRVANETVAETYVDYSTTYYFNTKKPLAGSAQANVELAGDGTMTKGSAQAEDKTLQTFLDLLPIKDVLTSVAKAELGIEAVEPGAEATKYELTISTQILKHTHYKYLTGKVPPCDAPKGPLVADYHLQTENITEPKKKANEGQTISVNGSIQLPKKEEPKK